MKHMQILRSLGAITSLFNKEIAEEVYSNGEATKAALIEAIESDLTGSIIDKMYKTALIYNLLPTANLQHSS